MSIRCGQALNAALHEIFERDERVYLLGEDLLDPYGGAFKISQGLSTRWPARVLTTPVSEPSIFGITAGLALRGYRPILEIMFGDFIALGLDQGRDLLALGLVHEAGGDRQRVSKPAGGDLVGLAEVVAL